MGSRQLQKDIMENFKPKGDLSASQINSKFMGYAHSRAKDDHAPKDPVVEFVKTWGLDEASEKQFKELSWQEQEKAMGAFNPPSDTQNINSKFLAFIRRGGKGKTPCKFWSSGSCKSGSSCPFSHDGPAGGSDSRSSHRKESREEATEEGPDAEALNLFVDAWDLSQEAQDLLFSLEGSVAFKVIEKFSPKADVGDVSNMFMGYAKSMVRNAGGSKGGDQWKRSADGGDDKSWKKARW